MSRLLIKSQLMSHLYWKIWLPYIVRISAFGFGFCLSPFDLKFQIFLLVKAVMCLSAEIITLQHPPNLAFRWVSVTSPWWAHVLNLWPRYTHAFLCTQVIMYLLNCSVYTPIAHALLPIGFNGPYVRWHKPHTHPYRSYSMHAAS